MNKILKQALGFSLVSLIGFCIDFVIYNVLTYGCKINLDMANIISSLVGVTFVFFTSTRKIFISNSKIDIRIKYVIYAVYQVILIFVVSRIMLYLKENIVLFDIPFIVKYVNVIVKVMVTPFTLLINFLVMKKLIEKL